MSLRYMFPAIVAAVLVPTLAAAQTAPQVPVAQPAPPQPAPATPALFPSESRIAFVDLNEVATTSVAGKGLLARLKTFRDGKLFELAEKQKQLDGLQTRMTSGSAVLSDTARTQLAKDIERMKREIQFGSQDADAELQQLQQEGFADLGKRITPILEAIAAERQLDVIFSRTETAPAFVSPRIDVSAEVTKRLDAAAAKK
jgi:Skp family chaperone for outer membrane proteins